MQRGTRQLVNAIRPTLGPLARTVAITSIAPEKKPEILDSGGIIARRIIQLSDPDEDMGAMLARQMLWQQQEEHGDGTATAAVLFQAVYEGGLRYIAAGGNAMRLRHFLEKGLSAILGELTVMTCPVAGKAQLAEVARAICHDNALADMLCEIFDIIGEYGQLDIQAGRGRHLEREYVQGTHWKSGIFSAEMLGGQQSVQLENAAILISDFEIKEPGELAGAVRAALAAQHRTLVIMARSLSEKVIGFLLTNRKTEKFQAIAVKTPGSTSVDQLANMRDLAILTGGQPLIQASGQALNDVRHGDLGFARTAWANAVNFGIIGGKGDPCALRRHLDGLRQSFAQADDRQTRAKLQGRIGRLMGGSATLSIGGATDLEIKARKELAQHAADAVRGAVREGVLPGGGAALVACCAKLRRLCARSRDEDERAAYRVLIRALQEPMRVIAANAGYDPSAVLAAVERARPGSGFNAHTGKVVDLTQVGIVDAASAQKAAVHGAIATAALALTVDVLIHRKTPPESYSKP